ncbi:MAG: hypothetical protein IPO88_09545 [Nannocystis sp.]|uniref:toxin-antitoxin system YwqK family antitoxin n=1 Tax=Nannocystis sp. TaxID=1962667 RepID=UPI0024249FA3|nr:hypothetical protein [Nannocystis sp.]MBK9753731.1 hypothetical protein [Nannocystis sp.]
MKFYPNGRRRCESFYRAGKLDGPSKAWTEDGELMGITIYEQGRTMSSKVFRYTLKEASPQELAAAHAELRRLLAEQQRLLGK